MKKLLLLFPLFIFVANTALAQDDELPPPSSKPNQTEEKKNDQKPPDTKDFKGFKKDGKLDLSKFIIEPIINFSVSQYRIDAGFSPSVGYRVWQPQNVKPRAGNVGLFLGGGIVYSYTGVTQQGHVPGTTVRVSLQTYGAGPLLQYNIWHGLFVRTKVELLARKIPLRFANYSSNDIVYYTKFTPAWLIGAGYNLLQSKNIFVPIIISYDLLHSVVDKQYSIYPRGFTVQLGFITLF